MPRDYGAPNRSRLLRLECGRNPGQPSPPARRRGQSSSWIARFLKVARSGSRNTSRECREQPIRALFEASMAIEDFMRLQEGNSLKQEA